MKGAILQVTTDFRTVLGEAAYKTLGAPRLDMIFPGSQVESARFPGLFLGLA